VGLSGYFGLTAVRTDGSGGFSWSTRAPVIAGSYSYVALKYEHNEWVIADTVPLQAT